MVDISNNLEFWLSSSKSIGRRDCSG